MSEEKQVDKIDELTQKSKSQANVIDMQSSVPSPEKEEDKQITSFELKELQGIADNVKHLREAIGAVEEQKSQMITQTLSLRNQIEGRAKKLIIDAGISEEDSEKYRIDLQTGKIVQHGQTTMPGR